MQDYTVEQKLELLKGEYLPYFINTRVETLTGVNELLDFYKTSGWLVVQHPLDNTIKTFELFLHEKGVRERKDKAMWEFVSGKIEEELEEGRLENCRRLHQYLDRKLKDGNYRRVAEVLDLGLFDPRHLQKTMLIVTKPYKGAMWIKEAREALVEHYYTDRDVV